MTEKRRRLPFRRTILLIAAVLLLAALVWILGPGARWVVDLDVDVTKLPEKDLATAADAVRGRALAIATGVVALVAVYYTARNADTARRAVELTQQTSTRTLELTEQGQVTDRYTKAIQQLGDSDNLHIRIGGIYALERIARDSEPDHGTVQEVLTAFVREYVPGPGQPAAEDGGTTQVTHVSKVPADVQAALTVIGRAKMLDADLSGANLTRANLDGANLTLANLSRANLTLADLSGANLTRANLDGANLTGAYLSSADLNFARMWNANLTLANLSRANLDGANLSSADLSRANLDGAYLTRADLRGARLTRAQYDSAATTESAIPPDRFLDEPSEEQAQSS